MIKEFKLKSDNLTHLFGRLSLLLGDAAELKVSVTEWKDKRSSISNRKMWACLGNVSKQVEWPVNGVMGLISADDWKDILSASLRHEGRIAQGIDGGFVMLGQRTSKMTIKQMSDLIEIIYAFGASHGVEWSEPVPPEYLEFCNYESKTDI